MKFSIKDFFSKFDQIRSFLRIWSHLLEKSLMENFFFVHCYNQLQEILVCNYQLIYIKDGLSRIQTLYFLKCVRVVFSIKKKTIQFSFFYLIFIFNKKEL